VRANTFASTTSLTMKTEDHAWRALNQHAAAQLRGGFANRVLDAARGPSEATWRQLQAEGAAQLRPGFAERVLRAARQLPGVPSLIDQFAFSLGTAAVCALAVYLFHAQSTQREDERNLARWQQIAVVVASDDPGL
jgi:hypothetical protein